MYVLNWDSRWCSMKKLFQTTEQKLFVEIVHTDPRSIFRNLAFTIIRIWKSHHLISQVYFLVGGMPNVTLRYINVTLSCVAHSLQAIAYSWNRKFSRGMECIYIYTYFRAVEIVFSYTKTEI